MLCLPPFLLICLCLHAVFSGNITLWSSSTANNATTSTPNQLQILNNGNVALLNSTGGVYWTTNTAGA
jgi:hypothetical protein